MNIKVFIDGQLKNTFTNPVTTSIINCVGGTLRFGKWWNSDPRWFNGSLDDIRFYNRALSDTEVQALYQAEAPPIDITTGLVAHYKMDGNVQDASGNSNHGTAQNGVTFATDRYGNAGKAASFDGTDDYVEVNHSASLNNYLTSGELTISYWINPDIGGTRDVIAKRPPTNNGGFVVQANPNQMGYDHVIYTNVGWKYVVVPYAQNEWQHIVFSAKANDAIKVFKNGVLSGSLSLAGNTFVGTTNNMRLMTNTMALELFQKGKLDQVQIFSRTLSDAEVLALYNSESSGVSLTTAMRLGGGLSTLNVGTGYNFTASLKNNGSASWVGDVYLKVKGGIPTIISSNNVISAGGTYNISSTFSPQTSQIGQNISVELLTKQGTNDFIRASVVNGTVNPIVVNIEAASSVPIVRVPFIRLNQSEVNLGGTVQIIGDNFEPNTLVTIGSSPDISGAIYQAVTVASDGSINATFTVPNTFKERYLTIIGRNVKYDNPGALVLVNQLQEVATLSITKPYKANETINITPEGNVAIEFSDKLLKGSAYPQSGASRSYRYEIGYQYGGETVYTPLKQLPVETDLLNKEIRKTVLVPMIGFSTISQSGGWVLKFIIKDMYNNQRVAESPLVNINVVQNISKISMNWDRSFSPMPNQDPIGIAADGVARMYLVLEKNSPTGSPIQSVSVTLANYESNNDPANFNNGAWLGRVKYANQQNNTQYSEEANGITTITAQNLSTNTDGKYWFWYVAPDDFTRDGAGYTVDSERDVYAKFTVVYADGTVELVTKDIQIVRPPLMLVHGLNGTPSGWNKFGLNDKNNPDSKMLTYREAVRMFPNETYDKNAKVLLQRELNPNNDYSSSFQNVLNNARQIKKIAVSQVDYVGHSMGGCMVRAIFEDEILKKAFYDGRISGYNYQKGYIHKFITINTPHDGSPWADLINGFAPTMNNFSEIITLAAYNAFPDIRNFINFPEPPLQPWTDGFYAKGTNAIINLQTNKVDGGIVFKQTNLKSHLISSDIYNGYDLSTSAPFLMDKVLVFNFSKPAGVLLNTLSLVPGFKSFWPYIYAPIVVASIPIFEGNEPSWVKPFWDLNKFELQARLAYAAISPSQLVPIVTKTTQRYGDYNNKYKNIMWDGDLIVPLKSQLAGQISDFTYLPTSQNITILEYTGTPNLDFNHMNVTDQPVTSNRVKELLNTQISSNLFNFIPANNSYQRSGFASQSSKNIINTNPKTPAIASANKYKDYFDRSKLKIISPTIGTSLSEQSSLDVIVQVLDTVGLKSISAYYQFETQNDSLKKQIYKFSFSNNPSLSSSNVIIANGVYIKGDSTIFINDTISVLNNTSQVLEKFEVNPKLNEVGIDLNFQPNYFIKYNTFLSSNIDKSKLNISISNTSCLSYNTQTGQFKGLQKGEAVVVFTYDGIFKDTMYVAVGGGGVPYTQQISTSNVPVTGDGTICTGATILVPFTTVGGVFDVGNQYIVQLSDASGENFFSLETTRITSPLSARIPNGLSNADTYKIRVVSTSPPVIGTVAVQPIKIRNQDATLITSLQSGNWSSPTTWSCGRVPSGNDAVVIKAGHTVTMPPGTYPVRRVTQRGTLQYSNGSVLQFTE